MSTLRSRILRGGGKISFRGTSLYTKADIGVNVISRVQALDVAMFGKLTDSKDDVSSEIDFTHSGEITQAIIDLLLPYFKAGVTWYPGLSIFDPNTDYPLTINSRDGRVLTFPNAALMTPPPLAAAGTQTLFGACKFVALRANGAPWSQAGSLFTEVPQAYPGDADFVRANIFRQPFLGSWAAAGTTIPGGAATATQASPAVFGDTADGLAVGDTVINSGFANPALNGFFTVATTPTSGTFTLYLLGTTTPVNNTVAADAGKFIRANLGDAWNSFTTEAGFSITPNVTTQQDKTDDGGVIDILYTKSDVRIECVPVGPSVNDVLAALNVQGGTAVRGGDVGADAKPLYLNGAGIYVKVPLASPVADGIMYSPTKKRIGKVTWNAETAFAANAPLPQLQVSTNPIA